MHIASFLKCFQGHGERNALVLSTHDQSKLLPCCSHTEESFYKEVGKGHASKNKWGKKMGAVLPALFQHMSHMYRIQDQHPHHRTKTK